MDLGDKDRLRAMLDEIYEHFNLRVNEDLLKRYVRGELPGLLVYSKNKKIKINVLDRYLIGVESFLLQPSLNYYDIVNLGRVVPMVVNLAMSIVTLKEKE